MASDARDTHGPYPLQLGPKPVRVIPFFRSEASETAANKDSPISQPPSNFWSPASGDASSDFGPGNGRLGRRRTLRTSPLKDASPTHSSRPASLTQERFLSSAAPQPRFFDKHFFEDDDDMLRAKRRYLHSYLVGLILTVMTMLMALLLHWGALRGVPVRPLSGIVVDFDGGVVGLNISMAILNSQHSPSIAWSYESATTYRDGPDTLARVVIDEQAWVAISVNSDASQILNNALLLPDPDYDGTSAISFYLNEPRSHSIYRDVLLPQTTATLEEAAMSFARNLARQIADSETVASVLATSPQTLLQPISYTVKSALPEEQAIESIASSSGLVYLLVASFMVAMFGHRARNRSGLNKQLRLGSLIRLRFVTSFAAFFVISLIYSALAKALHLGMGKAYGRAGFLVFWMLHWIGMLSIGLALEAIITLVSPCYLLYFVVIWSAVNVPTSLNPLEATSRFYRYGNLVPFYNMSQSVKTISLGTKNQGVCLHADALALQFQLSIVLVGLNFGVLILWIAISCVTMPVIQRRARLRHIRRLEEEDEVKRVGADLVVVSSPSLQAPTATLRGQGDEKALRSDIPGASFRVLRRDPYRTVSGIAKTMSEAQTAV